MTEKHYCPRRNEMFARGRTAQPEDEWTHRHGMDGHDRGCTYCGSMHPDDFLEAVRTGQKIGSTDKSYKFYVGGHGGKFYLKHLSPAQGWEFWELWHEGKVNFGGYPPYVSLYIPGPSDNTSCTNEEFDAIRKAMRDLREKS